jgi:hypothetical protein
MPEPRPITGQLYIGIKVAPDGTPCVLLGQPDGGGFMLPKEQGLYYGLAILAQVRNLFSSVEELEQALLAAKNEVDRIAPILPKSEPKDDRPIVQ